MRATFIYGWYTAGGGHWAEGHHWNPGMGEYDAAAKVEDHIGMMKVAKIDAAIASWWGKNDSFGTDGYLTAALNNTQDFPFAIYYEIDQDGSRPRTGWWGSINKDMQYLAPRFAHPNYLKVGGKPVVFVYCPEAPSNAVVDKWAQIAAQFGLYVSMTAVPNWQAKASLLDSWHTYTPTQYVNGCGVGAHCYSISVSPGFWKPDEEFPRLPRDWAQWQNALGVLWAYQPDWQLITTWNEWVEGSGIEPSNARCEDAYCMDYLNSLAAT